MPSMSSAVTLAIEPVETRFFAGRTNDHHFADEFGVFHQHNRQGLRVGDFFDLRLVTDEAEDHFVEAILRST